MTETQSLPECLASGFAQAMATHSPLSAVLAEAADFEALWLSGFEVSALYGLADVSLLTMSEHLALLRAISARCTIPIIADIDTGYGNAVNVDYAVRSYERAGAAAVVIEDKTFPKVTSLIDDGRQELLRREEFAGKIEAACSARQSEAFVIIARTEALIAGLGQSEALDRARAYCEAGADMVFVHSKQRTPDEIEAFIAAWDGRRPLVLAPTAYPEMTAERMRQSGKVGLAIWANHAIRSSVAAMRTTFERIRADGGLLGVEQDIASVNEIFALQNMDTVKAVEKRFLR